MLLVNDHIHSAAFKLPMFTSIGRMAEFGKVAVGNIEWFLKEGG